MNAYSMVVLLAVVLFFVVWGLGWLLETLSRLELNITHNPGSRGWYVLVGPGVALHESSHALGCVFTRTPIVEFKPINVEVKDNYVLLGYVKYRNPDSMLKRAVINLAPVAVSLVLLVFFALGATYLVPGSPGIGGEALDLLLDLINMKADPLLLENPTYPLTLIGGFIYLFLYTFAGLTVISPIFWIVAFLAMTIMFSNAPSDVDVKNSAGGLKVLLFFDMVWFLIAYFLPQAGWVLYGVFELVAVMFALALAFAGVAYGFFFMITAMARLRSPLSFLPLAVCLAVGAFLWYAASLSPALQTIIALVAFVVVAFPMLIVPAFRAKR
ncbi:MAG: hypothetical protein C4K49_00110 [Candidatus Thorarchaeota archaeon]|nr:MAG: hypothetical protein C4K49_00110 [Candidatus Thorarchaeota archaeon]